MIFKVICINFSHITENYRRLINYFLFVQVALGQLYNETETAILEGIANADNEVASLSILLDETVADFNGRVDLEDQKLDIFEEEMREDMKNLADELNIALVDISNCVFLVEQNISTFVSNASK